MCSVENCPNLIIARGLCNIHYRRYIKSGSTDAPFRMTDEERFMSKVDKGDGLGCWEWIGDKSYQGYGRFTFGNNPAVPAHRVSYEMFIGPIPEGLVIDHVAARGCQGWSCVNPEHLEPVTQQENVLRSTGPAAINARKTHCNRGHEFTEENTGSQKNGKGRNCKTCRNDNGRRYAEEKRGHVANYKATITLDDRDNIFKLYAEGYSKKELAAKFNCTVQTIHKYIKKEQ